MTDQTEILTEAEIEKLIGFPRHPTLHIGRALTDGRFAAMHPRTCLESGHHWVKSVHSNMMSLILDTDRLFCVYQESEGWCDIEDGAHPMHHELPDAPVVLGVCTDGMAMRLLLHWVRPVNEGDLND